MTWLLRDLETCPACHTRPSEWDPKRGGSRDAYRAEIIECLGCVEKQRTESAPELQKQRGLSVALAKNMGA